MPGGDDPHWRLLFAVRYRGPWERATAWLDAIDPDTGETRKQVRDGSLRSRLPGALRPAGRRVAGQVAAGRPGTAAAVETHTLTAHADAHARE